MDTIQAVFKTIMDLGPVVMMPIVLFILGIVFRLSVTKALRSALTVGAGFAGIYIMIDFFMSSIAPAALAMAEKTGSNLTIIDTGWTVAAAIAWASPIAYVFIPIGLGINVILLLLKLTKTLDINIWDYWHFILAGTFVYVVSKNFALGLAAASIYLFFILIMADVTQPLVASFFNLPNISFPLAGNAELSLIVWPINKLLDRVPFLTKYSFTSESVREKLGVIGEPVFQGAALGILIGILAGYSWGQVLLLAVNLGAAILLIPKVVAILMEALIPISEAAGDFMRKYTGANRVLYIGMDAAIGTGHSSILATAILMVPVTVLLAFILPGNRFLILSDLAVLVFPLMFAVVIARGDLVRSFILSIVIMTVSLYFSGWSAPFFEMAAELTKIPLPDEVSGAMGFSAAATGFEPFQFMLVKIAELPTAVTASIFIGITAVLTGASTILNRKKAQEAELEEKTLVAM